MALKKETQLNKLPYPRVYGSTVRVEDQITFVLINHPRKKETRGPSYENVPRTNYFQ